MTETNAGDGRRVMIAPFDRKPHFEDNHYWLKGHFSEWPCNVGVPCLPAPADVAAAFRKSMEKTTSTAVRGTKGER